MKILKFFFKLPVMLWRFIRKAQSAIGTLLFIFLFFIVISALSSGGKPEVKIDGAALMISLNGSVSEQPNTVDPQQMLLGGEIPAQHLVKDIIKSIKLAKNDKRIKHIILDLDGITSIGSSKIYYIGEALKSFKESEKKIYLYSEFLGQASYLLASYADEIYLHPQGGVFIEGYSSYRFYYKNFMNKIKADVSLFRVGKYKSAMEPYIRNDMSDADKLSRKELIGSLWNEYVGKIAENRSFKAETFKRSLNNIDVGMAKLDVNFAGFAKHQKLVDGLKSRTQWSKFIKKITGTKQDSDLLNVVNYQQYLTANHSSQYAKEKIAVVYVTGVITNGNALKGGGDRIARHLREVRKDGNVKAVIIRIDSPGGSAFASEIIREEILLLKEKGIRVIASMGSVAASGGYYVAADADEIWASPTTITGSIGIFGMIPNFEGTLNALGINVDGVGTTDLSPIGITKKLPEKFKKIMQVNIEKGYQNFVDLVANGRGVTVEEIEKVAQGRVWVGSQAVKNGLVDKLGTFDDTVIALAADLGLTNYKLVFWQDELNSKQKILKMLSEMSLKADQTSSEDIRDFMTSKSPKIHQKLISKIYKDLKLLSDLDDPRNMYLLCTECDVR